jgi:hypothetical protein
LFIASENLASVAFAGLGILSTMPFAWMNAHAPRVVRRVHLADRVEERRHL